MENYKSAIYNFIDKMGYLLEKDCEGIILYGSHQHGFEKEDSDIDLCIIYNEIFRKNDVRGYDFEDGYRIEYFERTRDSIIERAKQDLESGSNASLSMIGHGKIIFDRRGEISKIQKRIIEYYNGRPFPILSENEEKCLSFTFRNRLLELERLERENSPYFNHFYHLVLEEVRLLYYAKNGLPEIPNSKVYAFYEDDTYSQKLLKTTPPTEFINLYFAALDESKSNEEHLTDLTALYCYVKGDNDLEFKDTRIEIQPPKAKRKILTRTSWTTDQY